LRGLFRPAEQWLTLDRLGSIGRALRLQPWAKNALLFVPLLLAHALNTSNLRRTAPAFLVSAYVPPPLISSMISSTRMEIGAIPASGIADLRREIFRQLRCARPKECA